VHDDVGTQKLITWPTVTPDGQWIVYSRADSTDTRQGNGDLYMASAVTPNQEVRLASVDGDDYPFSAGSRDLSWNYEPSSAPVAAGGYFWVVFTSRRAYGNVLTGDKTMVKQLWVTAIDQSPQAGKDPSHPAFHLTGQAENLAMRGYWSLPPCKGDGQGCASGTDCCGGYCAAGGTCASTGQGCSQDGDKCNVASDCCGAAAGVVCINHVCSAAAAM
jgi:WD40-like Beta Propeller Repeat